MGLWPARRIASADGLHRGNIIAQGVLSCDEPLRSPIHGRPCAGFFYQASHLGWRTWGPDSRKILRKAVVYASPLTLRFHDGGELQLIPRKPESFDNEGHAQLAARDLPGFRASETVLAADRRVQVAGSAMRQDGRWVLYFDNIVRLDAARPREPEPQRASSDS
jgi:hypothetical protein